MMQLSQFLSYITNDILKTFTCSVIFYDLFSLRVYWIAWSIMRLREQCLRPEEKILSEFKTDPATMYVLI